MVSSAFLIGESVNINGLASAGCTGTTNFTAYISPYLVLTNGGNYTKHIYMGSQRIVSKLSNSSLFDGENPVDADKAMMNDFTKKYNKQTDCLKARYDSLSVSFNGTLYKNMTNPAADALGGGTTMTPLKYYSHSDHLGSSSLITDASGGLVQHLEYVPFGEVFIDERPSQSSWSTPYKFNGKELDEETGLYYYGARYMDPRTSVWISVDPLAEKYQGVSSYVYCLDNPVKFIDPDGNRIFIAQGSVNFQQRTFADIQKLTSQNLYLLKSGEVINANKYKGDESNIVSRGVGSVSILLPFKDKSGGIINLKDGYKPVGTKLVNDVIGNEKKFQIIQAGPDNEETILKKEHPEQVPAGFYGAIKYNPDSQNRGEKNEGDSNYGKPAFLALGHEFIHSIKAMLGKMLNRRDDVSRDPDTNGRLNSEEHDTRVKENVLRNENQFVPREIPLKD